MTKKILYVDMDGTLVDLDARIAEVPDVVKARHKEIDHIPGLYALAPPMPGAIEAFIELSGLFDTYILSTAPWGNPSAWQHKVEWVREHFGSDEGTPAWKRLILSHHKDLCRGDFLIDDKAAKHGTDRFDGELIVFDSPVFPDWAAVLDHLRPLA